MSLCRSFGLAMWGLAVLWIFAAPVVEAQQLPVIPWKVAATPAKTARVWTQALAPRSDGGMDYILQCWNNKSAAIPEWLVVDLSTGDTQRFRLPGYANSNYTMDTTLRAPNGRIFFSCTGMNVYVYDPQTHQIKRTGPISPEQPGYQFLFNCIIAADGNFYGATQSNNGRVSVVTVDSQTLATRYFPDLTQHARAEGLTYGYYVAADPPWVYVAVGKGQWTLAAVNTLTDERRVLADKANWISFDETPAVSVVSIQRLLSDTEAVAAEKGNHVIVAGDKQTARYWCIDGKLVSVVPGATPPIAAGKARNDRFAQIKLPKNPPFRMELQAPDSEGKFTATWARPGQITPSTTRFASENVEPVDLESLVYLPGDGSLFGNAQQYNGFFRYLPDAVAPAKTLECFGPHGPSGPCYAWFDEKLYFSGYPSGITFVYDPKRPWKKAAGTQMPGPETDNPRTLINLGGALSGAHHAYFMIPATNGRIYFSGHRERGMTGTGLAWFEPKTLRAGEQHNNLNQLMPRGLLVVESLGSVVLSGTLENDPYIKGDKATQAELVVFDLDLTERRRIAVKPGLHNTGWLFEGQSPGTIIGCVSDDRVTALYRLDLQNSRLLQWVDLPKADRVAEIFRHPGNGSWWAVLEDHRLCRFDPETLKLTPLGVLPGPLTKALWRSESLWGISGPSLVRVDGLLGSK